MLKPHNSLSWGRATRLAAAGGRRRERELKHHYPLRRSLTHTKRILSPSQTLPSCAHQLARSKSHPRVRHSLSVGLSINVVQCLQTQRSRIIPLNVSADIAGVPKYPHLQMLYIHCAHDRATHERIALFLNPGLVVVGMIPV